MAKKVVVFKPGKRMEAMVQEASQLAPPAPDDSGEAETDLSP